MCFEILLSIISIPNKIIIHVIKILARGTNGDGSHGQRFIAHKNRPRWSLVI